MIRRVLITALCCLALFLALLAVMMWTSESIWSLGSEYGQGTRVRVSFDGGGALIEYDGPHRDWWPAGVYACELARVEFDLAYVGSTIAPPELVLKSSAVVTLQPLIAVLLANMSFLVGLYPMMTLARRVARRRDAESRDPCRQPSADGADASGEGSTVG